MIRLRKTLPLAAALVLALPSCVLAIGNSGTGTKHPHEDCPECQEMRMDGDQASAVGHQEHGVHEALLAEEPALAARR